MSTRANPQNPSYDAIIDSARELFLEHGFPAVSMEAIARRASVVRATVYNNFADKESILGAIVMRYHEGYAAIPGRLRGLLTGEHTSFEIIETTIGEAFRWRLANARIRPLIDLAKALPTATAWNEASEFSDTAMRAWLLEVHRRDATRGLLRDGISVRFATATLWGMVDGALIASDVHAPRSAIRKATRQVSLLYWYAIYRGEPEILTRARRRAALHADPVAAAD
jgi:AcrR family transcriptional regulator